MYKKGQKIKLPRDMWNLVKQMIDLRETWRMEAFRQAAEQMGIGAKELSNENLGFRVNRDRWEGEFFNTDTKEVAYGPVSYDKIVASAAMLEACSGINQLIIHIINNSIKDIYQFMWEFKPETMELVLKERKSVPKSPDLADLAVVGVPQ